MTVWSVARRNVIGNARRVTLSATPLMLIVVVATIGVAAATAGSESFAGRINDRGGAQIVVTASTSGPPVPESTISSATATLGEMLRTALPHLRVSAVEQVTAPDLSAGEADTAANAFELDATLAVVDEHYAAAYRLRPHSGRLFTPTDFAQGRNVAVLGFELARDYNVAIAETGPVRIRVGDASVVVVGIARPSSRHPRTNRSIIVPRTAAALASQDERGRTSASDAVRSIVVASSIERLSADAAAVSAVVRSFGNDEVRFDVAFDANAQRDFRNGLKSLVASIKLLIGAAFLGCFGAALQLQHSGIKLRRREIGTRLALGYSNSAIRRMLLAEGTIVALLVGVASVPISLALVRFWPGSTEFILVTHLVTAAAVLALTLLQPLFAVRRTLAVDPHALLVQS